MEKESIKGLSHHIGILAETFKIQRITTSHYLENWLDATGTLNEYELANLDEMYVQAIYDGNYWNEEELKMRLVSLVFLTAKVEVPNQFKMYFERKLTGIIDSISINVVADCFLASQGAFNTPQKPYFFLQEYKKGRGDQKDPEAQMLAAMLIAQEINQDKKPLYGSYIIGTDWYFTVLIGRQYCCSREYDVRNHNDLLQIVFVLRKLKELILNRHLID